MHVMFAIISKKKFLRNKFTVVFAATTVVSHSNSASAVSDHSYGKDHMQRNTHAAGTTLDDEFLEWQNDDDCQRNKYEFNSNLHHMFEENFTNGFSSKDGKFDVVKFSLSAEVRHKFPVLSRLALGVFSIPASSSASE